MNKYAITTIVLLCIVLLSLARTVLAQTTPAIVSATLYNAATDKPIGPLVDGQAIDLKNAKSLSVVAAVSAGTKSVKFGLDNNPTLLIENQAPFAIAGDTTTGTVSDFGSWTPTVGTHRLTLTGYSETQAMGTASPAKVINFTVVDTTGPTTTPATTGPAAAPTIKVDVTLRSVPPSPSATNAGEVWIYAHVVDPTPDQYADLKNASKVTITTPNRPDTAYAIQQNATAPSTQPVTEAYQALLATRAQLVTELDAAEAARADVEQVQAVKLVEFVNYIGSMQQFQKEAGLRATTRPAEIAGLNAAADNTQVVVTNAKARVDQIKAKLAVAKQAIADARALADQP